jgi:hypothetical protein
VQTTKLDASLKDCRQGILERGTAPSLASNERAAVDVSQAEYTSGASLLAPESTTWVYQSRTMGRQEAKCFRFGDTERQILSRLFRFLASSPLDFNV